MSKTKEVRIGTAKETLKAWVKHYDKIKLKILSYDDTITIALDDLENFIKDIRNILEHNTLTYYDKTHNSEE